MNNIVPPIDDLAMYVAIYMMQLLTFIRFVRMKYDVRSSISFRNHKISIRTKDPDITMLEVERRALYLAKRSINAWIALSLIPLSLLGLLILLWFSIISYRLSIVFLNG
ncbi:hypothetical protein H6775_00430 [Candidatus Nomurabacteria bacterium]|nr:hypothetical protein [Candidatus Nomurabacteria bacterium]